MSLKIEMLRCFVTVAQTGSLAEAAMRLGRTPSALSMTLKQLEAHLDQKLFETERKNKLTTLGEYVLETAQAELVQFDNTVRSIETFARAPQGLLRIASVPSIAAMVFPKAIEQFSALHPNVTIELQDMDSPRIVSGVSCGDFDIGIATSAGTLRDITKEVLFEDSFGLVCAHDHALALQSAFVSMDDLTNYPFVQNELCTGITDVAVQTLLKNTKLTARNTLSLISILRTKPWVTILPRSVVQIDPQKLAFRQINGMQQNRRVALLRKSSSPKGFVQDFAGILMNIARQHTDSDKIRREKA